MHRIHLHRLADRASLLSASPSSLSPDIHLPQIKHVAVKRLVRIRNPCFLSSTLSYRHFKQSSAVNTLDRTTISSPQLENGEVQNNPSSDSLPRRDGEVKENVKTINLTSRSKSFPQEQVTNSRDPYTPQIVPIPALPGHDTLVHPFDPWFVSGNLEEKIPEPVEPSQYPIIQRLGSEQSRHTSSYELTGEIPSPATSHGRVDDESSRHQSLWSETRDSARPSSEDDELLASPNSQHTKALDTATEIPKQAITMLADRTDPPTPTTVADWSLQPPSDASDDWKLQWKGDVRKGKLDLSYWNTVRGERDSTYPAASKPDKPDTQTNFRANRGPRAIVAAFLDTIYPHLSSTAHIPDHIVQPLLQDPVFNDLRIDPDYVIDIMNWSWIVAAPPELRVKRLVHLSRLEAFGYKANIPLWLVLQLLRTERILPQDFTELQAIIEKRADAWDQKASIMILVARCIRHARSTTPTLLNSVIEQFIRLLNKYRLSDTTHERQIRAHWCNRVLTLLSIPTSFRPFMTVILQQDAQLLLLHYMHDLQPSIPLNREGYRALVKVQMMHKKTESEKSWARVQADTWPPWEKENQMGVITPPRTTAGSNSRVNMVLQRMREDGYSGHGFDIAAAILGGRDSDGSPTIQVRRKSSTIASKTPWLPGNETGSYYPSGEIWAARITATRSVREAWMGFCAYENMSRGHTQSRRVYLAMFKKLWAKTIIHRQEDGPLPGDGTENFLDPELPRDRVHLPEEPPTIESLYKRMRARDIRPTGRLLSHLLMKEKRLDQGLKYIEDSNIKSERKEVLAQPTLFTPAEVVKALSGFNVETVSGYISLLARPNTPREQPLLRFKSGLTKNLIPGPAFAAEMMHDGHYSDPHVLTDYLSALASHMSGSYKHLGRIHITHAWRHICDSYGLDGITFHALPPMLSSAWTVQTWVPRSCVDVPETLEMAQRFFITAATGKKISAKVDVRQKWDELLRSACSNLQSIPTADVLQEMAFLIVAAHRENAIDDILGLLRWTVRHKEQIESVSTFTKRNMSAFRTYVEGNWAKTDPDFLHQHPEVRRARMTQLQDAQQSCNQLGGWVEDDDVSKYLLSSRSMFERIKTKIKAGRSQQKVETGPKGETNT